MIMTHSVALLAATILASCSATPQVDPTAEAIRKVETGLGPMVHLVGDSTWTIEERMANYGVPGVSIAVIKDGKVAWTKTYGVTDKETKELVTNSTLFQAGSISKPVAAYGALKLVELKKLALDSDINTQLRSWQLPDNQFTQQQKVTLRHLLGHTGGTTVHGFPGYSPDEPVPSLTQILNGESPANTPAIVVDKVPGGEPRYSGGGYCIIQQLMMDAQGTAFPSVMDELVLGPLGMAHSTYTQPLTGDRLKMASTGYLPDGSMVNGKRHTYPEMAAAGLWTTAEDLAKYVVDLQRTYKGEKGAVLSKASATKMLSPSKDPKWGTGMFLYTRQCEPYFEHGGWDEGFCAQLMAHRDKGYGVVVLINANQPDFIWELIRSVARAYEWDNYVLSYRPLANDLAALKAMSGRYRTGSDALMTISNIGGHLLMQDLINDTVELFRITDSTYVSRTNAHPVQFKQHAGDGTLEMVRNNERDGTVLERHARMTEGEHVPFEFLLAGRAEEALDGYRALKSVDPNDDAVQERTFNDLGYAKLNEGKTVLARDLFYVNMHLYPESANVYDSYAEACLKNGEKELALLNYKKALAMAPENSNAARVIKELEGKK